MKIGLLGWLERHNNPDNGPRIEELRVLAAEVLDAAQGHHTITGLDVYRQLIQEMGGPQAWEALHADLAIAQEKFEWLNA